MTQQILAWLLIIAAFTAVGLLVDYWRIRRAHPEIFRRTPGGQGNLESGETISGMPKYWLPGSLDLRNPERYPSSRIEPPQWTSLD